MAISLQLYKAQVFQFLQTCTIKFSPIADRINYNLQMSGHAVDLTDPTTWKYYINLSGEYHSTDQMMSVISLDTRQTVNFTKEMLAAHPKTRAAYIVGSSYYDELCKTYPDQVDLVKSIVYPVDIMTAITASEFTLLGWSDGYLEENEQDAIIAELLIHIDYAVTRWYYSFFSYEVYYPWAYWGIFWQSLPGAIFAARLKQLHKSSVHSFHIWSYLMSRGIGDYSDVLTSKQALFLYRNIDYLRENRGKQSNIVVLADNLLYTLNVGLVGKTVYMNTETDAVDKQWVPEFVSKIIPTKNSQSLTLIAPESMTILNAQMVSAKLEVDSSGDHILKEQKRIGETVLNILPTKLVEIQKLDVDQKYGSILDNFVLDTVVSMVATDRYVSSIDITDPTTKLTMTLSTKDALALFYYTIGRSSRDTPIHLPTVYTPSCAFRYDAATAVFPTMFTFNGLQYPTRTYLDVNELIKDTAYPLYPVDNPEDFGNLVANLFTSLLRCIRYSRTIQSLIGLKMLVAFCEDYVFQNTYYTLNLSPTTDYVTWIANNKLNDLIEKLDSQEDFVSAYNGLGLAILTALVPETNSIYSQYGYTSPYENNKYDRLKSLFQQLCSYNIAFLDTNRINSWWTLLKRILLYPRVVTTSTTVRLNPLPSIKLKSITETSPLSLAIDDIFVKEAQSDIYPITIVDDDMTMVTAITDTQNIPDPVSLITKPVDITDVIPVTFVRGLGVVMSSMTTTGV